MDVMHTAAEEPDECPTAKRARNAMRPMIGAAIEKAWALNEAIELADRE
ncbi:MAG: hypothetical protein U5K36_17010 [Roseovarius sp.]|nr:hypothetical protein [Roseovarius sp.]